MEDKVVFNRPHDFIIQHRFKPGLNLKQKLIKADRVAAPSSLSTNTHSRHTGVPLFPSINSKLLVKYFFENRADV